MKTETKSKIKKALKVGAYVGGLMLALVLGMGFGSCSEKKMQDQSSQKAEPKQLKPRLAVDFSSYDILSRAEIVQGFNVVCYNPSDVLYLRPNVNVNTYVIPRSLLPEGSSFVLTFNGSLLNGDTAYPFVGVSNFILQKIRNVVSENVSQSDPVSFKVLGARATAMTSPYSLTIPSGFFRVELGQGGANIVNLCFSVMNNVTDLALYPADVYWREIAPRTLINLPEQWQPLNLWGKSYDNEVFGSLFGVSDGRVGYQGVMNLHGYVDNFETFQFTALRFYFVQMHGMKYLNSSGNIVNASTSAFDTLYYCNIVEAYNADSNKTLSLWWADFGTDQDGNVYLGRGGKWLDGRYRNLYVYDYSGLQGVGVSNGYPEYNYIEWLSVVNAGGGSIYTGGGDVFSLIGDGFSSITSLLNIQILPFLTLGTLLLSPLVIILALAILKVLNK